MSDHLIRIPEVMETTGLSRTTIYRLMNAGTFPRSVQITPGLVSWWEGEIEAWLQSRPRTQRASERVSGEQRDQELREKPAA